MWILFQNSPNDVLICNNSVVYTVFEVAVAIFQLMFMIGKVKSVGVYVTTSASLKCHYNHISSVYQIIMSTLLSQLPLATFTGAV